MILKYGKNEVPGHVQTCDVLYLTFQRLGLRDIAKCCPTCSYELGVTVIQGRGKSHAHTTFVTVIQGRRKSHAHATFVSR